VRHILFAADVIALAYAMGCSREDAPPTGAVKPMPIITLKYSHQPDRTEFLDNPYGFLISWNEGETPRFYVYDATRWRIDATGDFDEFLRLLSALPGDIRIRWVTSCGGGFCWAMPKGKDDDLERLRAGKRWRYVENEENSFGLICTCESKEVVFLEKAP
jgi:hypothetical protein